MDNIIFIGMPASGKSTVGVIVARALGYGFIDGDIAIQNEEGMLLRDIIETRGIEGFLEVENRVNLRINPKKTVISPGGSIVYCQDAMAHYKSIGTVIYLHTSYEMIEKRIRNAKNRGVTLRENQTLRDLYEERLPLFKAFADIIICQDGLDVEGTLHRVLEEIEARQGRGKKKIIYK